MKLAIKTCTLDMPYEQMLDFCVEQKIAAIEIGTGNWSGAPHCDLDLLVSDKTAREKWYDAMREKGLELCALNCSGNPLAYEKDMDVTKKTFELAHQLGVKKIVMMSGLPVGCEGDKTPVWITTSWPPETQDILDYQWNQARIHGRSAATGSRTACWIPSRSTHLPAARGTMLPSARDTMPSGGRSFSRLSACRATTMRFPLKWKI